MLLLITLFTGIAVKYLVQWLKPWGLSGATLTPVVAWALGILFTWIEVQFHAPGTAHVGVALMTILGLVAGSVAGLVHDSQSAINGTYSPKGTTP